jgi:DNA-binding response OmpR family regulator
VLIVDDNRDLLLFLERLVDQAGWKLLTAQSAGQAREIFAREKPSTVLLDYMLGDDDGVRLALQFQMQVPGTQVIIMTGGVLPSEDETICQARDIPILRKPFVASDLLGIIRSRLSRQPAASAVDTSGTQA